MFFWLVFGFVFFWLAFGFWCFFLSCVFFGVLSGLAEAFQLVFHQRDSSLDGNTYPSLFERLKLKLGVLSSLQALKALWHLLTITSYPS